MSKHSPTPWTVVPLLSGSENHRGYRIASGNDWYLADVRPGDEDGLRGAANARLIAAAPELLQFAKNVRDSLATGAPLHTEALAAIAKATGETDAA
jgi:hypothetical protein